jgi:hypothetical protein
MPLKQPMPKRATIASAAYISETLVLTKFFRREEPRENKENRTEGVLDADPTSQGSDPRIRRDPHLGHLRSFFNGKRRTRSFPWGKLKGTTGSSSQLTSIDNIQLLLEFVSCQARSEPLLMRLFLGTKNTFFLPCPTSRTCPGGAVSACWQRQEQVRVGTFRPQVHPCRRPNEAQTRTPPHQKRDTNRPQKKPT